MPVNFPFAQPLVPATAFRTTDDLKQGSTLYRNYWGQAPGSATAAAIIGDGADQYGVYRARITNVGQVCGIRTGIYWLPLANFFLWQCNYNIVTALSDGTNRYRIQVGLTTGEMTTLPTAGIGFSYQDNENNGRWQAFFINGAQSVTFDSLAAANLTRNAFRIMSPGANGPFVFLVNDRIIGSVQPQAAFAVPLRVVLSVAKLVGSTQRDFSIDYNAVYWTRPEVSQ